MTSLKRLGILALCVALAASAIVPLALRGAAPATPAPQAATGSPSELNDKVEALDRKITNLMPTTMLLARADFRAGDGQKVRPLMVEAVGLLGDLEKALKADPRLKGEDELINAVHVGRRHTMGWAAALGDKDMAATLEALAKEKTAEGTGAKSTLALVGWLTSSNDAAAQQKVLEDFTAVAKDNPDNSEVLESLAFMANVGPANGDIEKKVVEVIRSNMKGADAKELVARWDGAQEQKAMVGKPLAIAGRTSAGESFNSAAYKGKVVMLDFWATWCGPCIQELPNVKAVYKEYHDRGFEIVGVSCDANDEVLNTFIKDKEMPWVQLRESSQIEPNAEHPDGNWHPLAKKFHVDGIPQMFLIDRNGNLRYVDAREDLAKKIAQLVAEPVKTDAPAPK